jgi:hypothetical protein
MSERGPLQTWKRSAFSNLSHCDQPYANYGRGQQRCKSNGAAYLFEKRIDPNHQTTKHGEISQREPPPQQAIMDKLFQASSAFGRYKLSFHLLNGPRLLC